jgi:hypothetical protein
MAEHVPARDAQRLPERGDVARVVLDARRPRSRRYLRLAAAALIVEDELPPRGERREGGPEEGVCVEQSAVHAEQRRGAGDRGGGPDGEIEPADGDAPFLTPRGARQRSAEGEEALVGVHGPQR